MDVLEIGELLVEMTRQQQRRVGEVAIGDLDGAFAVLQGEIGGAERDRQHQRGAAQHEPLDGADASADRSARFR